MLKILQKKLDPALGFSATHVNDEIVLHPGNDIYNVIEYDNMYFTKDSFIAKAYVSDNGIVFFIPTQSEVLEDNLEEQKRLSAVTKQIKEILQLHLYIYTIFFTENTFYYGRTAGDRLIDIRRIPDASCFLNNILYGMNEESLEPNEISEEHLLADYSENAYYLQDHLPGDEYFCHRKFMEDEVLRRIDNICTKYENNIRPTDSYRVDEDGTEWICRDKTFSVGRINTGLINGKEWYRLTDDFDTEHMSLLTTFLGWTGIHWLFLGKKLKALGYLLTGGCFGMLPFVDVLQMAMGTFTYTEVDYDSHQTIRKNNKSRTVYTRQMQKVYFRKPQKWYKTALLSILCLAIGLAVSCTLYVTIYRGLGILSEDASIGIAEFLRDSGMMDKMIR